MTKQSFIKKILESVVLVALLIVGIGTAVQHVKMTQMAMGWFDAFLTTQRQIQSVQSGTEMMMAALCSGLPNSERIIFNPSADGKKADFGFVCANNPKGHDSYIKTKNK